MSFPVLKEVEKRRQANQRRLRTIFVILIGGFFLCFLATSLILALHRLPSQALLGVPKSFVFEESRSDFGCPIFPMIAEMSIGTTEDNSTDAVTSTAAVVTRKSNQHLHNQDRAFILEPFLTEQTPRGTKSFLVAILDGHSVEGHIVAEYVSHALPQRLAEKLSQRPCCQSDSWIMQMMKDTFIEVNQEAPPNALRGGTTASVSLRIGDKLFVANVGDSQTMLVHSRTTNGNNPNTNSHEIMYRSRRDKAHLPDERARIKGLGGKIHIPPQFPGGSRVIVFSASARPPETIGLAMSRSIGDWEWKPIGVTAEPIVDVVPIEYHNDTRGTGIASSFFLIAASDGVWDMRRPEFFAKRIGETLLFGRSKPVTGLFKTCAELIMDVSPAKKEWYRDDMTLAVVQI